MQRLYREPEVGGWRAIESCQCQKSGRIRLRETNNSHMTRNTPDYCHTTAHRTQDTACLQEEQPSSLVHQRFRVLNLMVKTKG